ncbi:MAG: cyclic nucleotide-binding domain-containing protein [Alphaproteobacteria bacterium]
MAIKSSLDHPNVLDRQVFHSGKVIFKEGADGNCAYLIQTGTVDIIRDTDEGIIRLGRLKPGAIFGEMALIDGSPRMATAVAVEATTVVVVKSDDLKAKIQNTDPFVARLLGMLVNNLRRVTDDHVSGKPLPFWDAGATLDLEYSPDEISQAMAVGPYIRR